VYDRSYCLVGADRFTDQLASVEVFFPADLIEVTQKLFWESQCDCNIFAHFTFIMVFCQGPARFLARGKLAHAARDVLRGAVCEGSPSTEDLT
jgi:hypothetical protein